MMTFISASRIEVETSKNLSDPDIMKIGDYICEAMNDCADTIIAEIKKRFGVTVDARVED